MEEIITKLDNYLSAKRPEFHQRLNDPLTDAQLNRLEDHYGIELPEDLRKLYRWKNGQKADFFDAFVNNSMFVPLNQALFDNSELNAMIGLDFEIENWWNYSWIPIFQNGGGDSICYDTKGIFTGDRGQLIEFWHGDHDRNVVAPTLGSFLSMIINLFENKKGEDFDEYFKIGKIEDYPKKFIVA